MDQFPDYKPFQDTQERTRKRIKEDLKDSSSSYNDYAETILPKLKSRYTKKFSEVEVRIVPKTLRISSTLSFQEQKRAAAAPAPVPSSLPSPSIGPEHQYLSNSRSNPSIPSRPAVTSPQPLRALDRRPSGSASSGRNRSPSSSTAFSDLAHQGKR